MVTREAPRLHSFIDVDPYSMGPKAVPLHPPPPRLPDGAAVQGGRHEAGPSTPFETPAFKEDLLIIHMGFPLRLSLKLEKWRHADSLPGDFVLLPRGHAGTWDNAGRAEAMMVSIPPSLSAKTIALEATRAPNQIEFIPHLGHSDPFVYAIGQAFLGELQNQGLFGMLYMESLLRTLSLHLLRNYAVVKPTQTSVKGALSAETLQRIRDYIHDHLNDEITLESLAEIAHLSPYHFTRLFKAATGMPPYQYVLQCRVEQAKALLITGRHSISEVADMVGFATQSHLNRHVRKMLKVTPRELLPTRKNRQE